MIFLPREEGQMEKRLWIDPELSRTLINASSGS